MVSNYDKYPKINIKGHNNKFFKNYSNIVNEIKSNLGNMKVIVVETYPGVHDEEIIDGIISPLKPALVLYAKDACVVAEEYKVEVKREITEDRVFGVLTVRNLDEFFVKETILEYREKIEETEGLVIVYGVGASIIHEGDMLVYADMARWEIQKRYRNDKYPNLFDDNYDDEKLAKYKRGFFIEWRMADRLKRKLYDKIDYLLDTNIKNEPKMITGKAFRDGLLQAATKPFRLVPYFDTGVWGGQWMKEVCDLDRESSNFAWAFDGVPEENSVYLQFGSEYVEIPSINIVFKHPKLLLGEKVHSIYGAEFPIRFDFLDTMQGQNLSLQVHPITEYIQQTFGMHYTQNESYYMLDTGENAHVFLGTKTGINHDEMITALKHSQETGERFNDEKYINKFPANKHDHFLIPAGTVHCSGSDSMVLEISNTPYIFTFKLWDWGRLGLDGKPRPIHIEHGEKVIQWDRDTKWCAENLVNKFEVLYEDEDYLYEKTGLHDLEPIDTFRHTFNKEIIINNNESVNMLNLVEGREAIVESLDGSFESLVVHYAETFIVPEVCKKYRIRSFGESEGKTIKVIQACVRV